MIEALRRAEEAVADVKGHRSGRLRLGSFPSASATLLATAIPEFRLRYPRIDLELLDVETDTAIGLLRAHELDLALIYDYATPQPSHPGLDLTPLGADPMRVALAESHRLAARDRVFLGDLSADSWIQGPPGCCCRTQLIHHCRALGFDPDIVFVSEEYHVIQSLVARSVGVSLIPALALHTARPGIITRPVNGRSGIARWLFASRRHGSACPPADAMVNLLPPLERVSGAGPNRRGGTGSSTSPATS